MPQKRRLAIFLFYDDGGVVHDYVPYLLRAVKQAVTRLVVVVNGSVNPGGEAVLRGLADGLFIRENVGLDIAAWQAGILTCCGKDEVRSYDELLLLNDSFFGPFYPFEEVFDAMERRGPDFWGLTAHGAVPGSGLCPYGYRPRYIQSYFMVFGQRLLRDDAFFAFWEQQPIYQSYGEAAELFVAVLTRHFADLGYSWDTYCDTRSLESENIRKNFDPHTFRLYYLLSQQRYPVIKRRSFRVTPAAYRAHGVPGELERSLNYIRAHYDYDLGTFVSFLASPTKTKSAVLREMRKGENSPARSEERGERLLGKLLEHTPEEGLNEAAFRLKNPDVAREVCFERGHVFRFLPMGPEDRVLEASDGYGGIAARLAGRCGAVDTLTATGDQAALSRLRNRENGNVTVHLGPLAETLAGLPAAAYRYILLTDLPPGTLDLLPLFLTKLRPGGRLCWVQANPLGLKYWAGCVPPGANRPFGGLENPGLPGKEQLSQLLCDAGVTDHRFLYPYPDHVNTYTMYTDNRLPQTGELIFNSFRWEKRRAALYDEAAAWDNLLAQGRFPDFANSFFVEMRAGADARPRSETSDTAAAHLLYGKISPVRDAALRILTRIDRDPDGVTRVRKEPLSPAAQAHIDRMPEMYTRLSALYRDTGLSINRLTMEGETACFEYLPGPTLSEVMVQGLRAGGRQDFFVHLERLARLLLGRATLPFTPTPGFAALFPGITPPGEQPCAPCTDLDLNFDNILVQDGAWQVIDYEFSYDFPIPARFVLYRALHHFFGNHRWIAAEDPGLRRDALSWLGFTRAEERAFDRMEGLFQAHVGGGGYNLEHMRIGKVWLLRRLAVDPRWGKAAAWLRARFPYGTKERKP